MRVQLGPPWVPMWRSTGLSFQHSTRNHSTQVRSRGYYSTGKSRLQAPFRGNFKAFVESTQRFLKTPVFPLTKPRFFAIISRLNLFSACANMAQLVEQLIRNQQVEGSSPSIGSLAQGRALNRGVAQFGSAFGSGPKGRGFESRHFDTKHRKIWAVFLICTQYVVYGYKMSYMVTPFKLLLGTKTVPIGDTVSNGWKIHCLLFFVFFVFFVFLVFLHAANAGISRLSRRTHNYL